ncbi:hypothetical protein [Alloactinosynnema sp. L-07]|uniref:hypothetical protein n=1 Tax=Alloactinosynnema sp. L-07 TaxID=1653480 RepID=UPI00065EF915|nr:hypothetical protein [Alloactinosynnema sp. L-07]CRK59221.1 hypothetical protein [Alloactinosynnema sp. L-07]
MDYPAETACWWGSSPHYRGRAHLIVGGARSALCGILVDESTGYRPFGRTCPECALAYVDRFFVPTTRGWPS